MKLLKLSRGRLLPALEEPLAEVSLEDWRDNPQEHADATALRISNATSLADIKCDIHGFSVIILDFPAFKDGRAYSQARLLRQRYGYTGEIRARGDILRERRVGTLRRLAWLWSIVSPQGKRLPTGPPRAAFSHSASVGRR